MAVKGKGKQVATDAPGASGSSGKRWKGSGDAGPSSSSAKRRRRSGVLQFVDDAAGVDDDYEEEEEGEGDESEEDLDDVSIPPVLILIVLANNDLDVVGFFTEKHVENVSHKRTERSHPLPFLVKEEELSGDELEEFVRKRYSTGVKYASDRNYHQQDDDDQMFPMDGALKEPTIWRVKCMVGRERQMAFCFMQKFVDLQRMGTRVPIITAFALDHVRGFVFVEAEKACDVTEACKGFCSVYSSRITSVPAAEVPSLLSSRTKPFEIARGTWVRVKNGNYKGDLAQVVSADDGRKRVMIKLIPRGGAISLKEAGIPAPRLISSQELEFFRPHIEMKRDRQTGEVFEVLDSLMFKDGFLYKRVALSSLIYWGIQPTETELLKFSSSPSNKSSVDDLDWVSSIYGSKKRNLPVDGDMKASSSKTKSSKATNLKASTSTEIFDDNEQFDLHDLVLFGRKDFGVVIAIEKDGFKILKGGPEGCAVTVKKQDIKKSCIDKMFTAVDHQKKIISINDTVRVLEGPSQGKEGVVKHLYLGILFIYNESESMNCGFFCAQCGSCENIKKRKEMGSSTTGNLDNPIPMFSEPSYEHTEQRAPERPYRSTREQLFSIGQMLRIRKGPLKGYLCRVVRMFRNDVTVKLDSLLKIVTVQAELLSVPSNRGDISSGAPTGNLGSQNTTLFGSEADKTSWDNGLPSFGSDSWQPFSSSTLQVQNTDGASEGDPWGKKTVSTTEDDSDPWSKKTVPSADADSDPWGKKMGSADDDSDPWGKKTTSSAAEVWSSTATQQESSIDNAWGKQAGFGGSDAAGNSWDRPTVNKESEKSDNWGDVCRVEDEGTGANTDPWGSKVKVADSKENDSWGKASIPSDSKTEDANQGWGQPLGKSNDDEGKDKVSKDVDNSGSWDTRVAEDGAWDKAGEVRGEDQNSSWSRPGSFRGGRGQGRGSGRESGDFDGRNDQGSWKSSWGGDPGRPSWRSDNQVDDEAGDSGGYRGRGRGRGQYGGRGRGRDNGWRNGDGSNSGFGRESDNNDEPKWGNTGPFDSDKGASNKGSWGGGGDWNSNPSSRQPSTWNGSEDNKPSAAEHNDPWASKTTSTKGIEPQITWESKTASTAGAEDNGGSWNSKEKESSHIDGKEQETDPWASKMSSTVDADDNNDSWNTKAKDTPSGDEEKADAWGSKGGNENSKKTDGWGNGSSGSSWDKPSFSLGEQEPAWSKQRLGDDNNGNGRGGFGRGNRGGGRGRSFRDGGSSWNGGNNNDESGGGRSEDQWNRSDFDGSRGRGRGRFGRGGRNQGNDFGSGDGGSWGSGRGSGGRGGRNQGNDFGSGDGGSWGSDRGNGGQGGRNQGNDFGSGDGGSWGSGRGNGGRGGYRNWSDNNERRPFSQGDGWSQSSDWNSNKGASEGDQGFSKSKPSWGNDNNDSWGARKPFGGDDQAGKNDVKSNEDGWNSSRGTGAAEKSSWGGSVAAPKQGEGSGSQGGGGSSWDKADDAWNSKGDDTGNGGW
ncbi:hypothetical protein EJB05_36885 [Eragrostis curvula]|uniref:KOW domain-containing protein n=1 Tax=Eragrostis curvula TaxID=38414 RepID=A0A5J9UBD2_9POAL|nr:hypothetical protein EJB05_36885 [Eragrostis curvula]